MRRALVLCAATVLTACMSVPPPEAPPAQRAAQDLGLGKALASPVDATWWRTFADPQLDRLMASALHDNPSLAQAAARLRAAQAQWRREQYTALPTVALSAAETRARIPSGFPEALAGGESVWVGNLGMTLDWDLDLWGRNVEVIARSAALARAARLDVEVAHSLVIVAMSQAYLELYRAHQLADIATAAETQRRAILEATQKRVAAGLDTRIELRNAEGAIPQAHQALLQAHESQEQAVHKLAALSGLGAESYQAIARPILNPDAVLQLPDELPINLLARRPDVLAAWARVQAADAQRATARAAWYPRIGLRALAGFASFSLRDLLGAKAFGYGAGGNFALPLFDTETLRAGYEGASAQLAGDVAAYNQTVLTAIRQVADQLSTLRALQAEREQQQLVLAAAEESYRLAERRYRGGLATIVPMLNAETQVFDARRQSLALQVAQLQARIVLLLQVGGSFRPIDDTPAATAVAVASP